MILRTLLEQNLAQLESLAEVVRYLDDEVYRSGRAPGLDGTLGAHARHTLDHYACFVDGVASGGVDYDARERDSAVELDREACLARIEEIVGGLRALGADSSVIRIRAAGDPDREARWVASSIERELVFLISHTVHHCAMISAALRASGVTPPEGFGYAPSTLRYLRTVHPGFGPQSRAKAGPVEG